MANIKKEFAGLLGGVSIKYEEFLITYFVAVAKFKFSLAHKCSINKI